MRDPTPEELTHLKEMFKNIWDDAARAIVLKAHPQHVYAACQWMGFKKGYILAKEEAEG